MINSVGFGGIGVQAVSTHRAFYGCLVALSRSNDWLYFPGEQETCNQCIRIRFCVAHVISGFLYFFVLILWVLKAGH